MRTPADNFQSRLSAAPELTCPQPEPLQMAEAGALVELLAAIRHAAQDFSPIDTVGLELKVGLLAIGGSLEASKADNEFWLRKCRELSLRPAVEPLLLGYWGRLRHFDMTEPQIAAFCSLLSASRQTARTQDTYGLWEGSDIRFESVERAQSWWSDIQAAAQAPELKSLLPFYSYARTIIAHPFPDGNGRLARALLLAALVRDTDISAPILPLAPAFYKNGASVAEALHRLSGDGDWDSLATALCEVVMDALAMLQKVRPMPADRARSA